MTTVSIPGTYSGKTTLMLPVKPYQALRFVRAAALTKGA
jgi:hypothetical protein